MKAEVEQPDGSFKRVEMGEPKCGEDFCDTCGDCLACFYDDCYRADYCGCPRWVIYLDDPKNPNFKEY